MKARPGVTDAHREETEEYDHLHERRGAEPGRGEDRGPGTEKDRVDREHHIEEGET
jgi:hypothetical protein